MEKKNIDWENLDFGYRQTDKRFVANYKDGAWDEGTLTEDANIVLNECAGVLQYAQTVFEGLKAYTTVDGKVVIFRPDLNGRDLIGSRSNVPLINCVVPFRIVRSRRCACTLILFRLSWFP